MIMAQASGIIIFIFLFVDEPCSRADLEYFGGGGHNLEPRLLRVNP